MFFTRRGDDGFTDLLGGGRVAKDDVRIAALGDADEATSAIGLCRAQAQRDDAKTALLHVQKDLYLLMADIATVEGKAKNQSRLTQVNIDALEALIQDFDSRVTIPNEFVASGDSLSGAQIDFARAIVRRAERTVTLLQHVDAGAVNPTMVAYLNRLSSFLFGLARYEDAAAGAEPTISKTITE